MRLRFLVVVLTLLTAASGEVLSRAEAVRVALNANPEVLKSREQLRYYEGRIMEERSAALPDLRLNGNFYRYYDASMLNSPGFDLLDTPAPAATPTPTPDPANPLQGVDIREVFKPIPSNIVDGGFQVRQTLYSFKLGQAIRAAKVGKLLGGADLKRVQQQIALDTVRAYNALLYSMEQVRVQQNALEQLQKHLEITTNRRAAGVATELDVLRSQVNVENQRAEVTRAEGGVELARAQLNALMLRPMDAPITPSDTLSYQPADFLPDDVINRALANRPDLAVADLTLDIRERLLGVTKAENKPSLDFVGNYGRAARKPENFLNPDFSTWRAAISLSIPIFDGNRTKGRVAQAQAEVGKARQDKIALQNQIRLQAMDSLVKLNVAARLISAAQLNVEQAKKALGMTQANYNYGAATLLDITDAQNALVQAETTLAMALQQHSDARATVNYVMGLDPAGPYEELK